MSLWVIFLACAFDTKAIAQTDNHEHPPRPGTCSNYLPHALEKQNFRSTRARLNFEAACREGTLRDPDFLGRLRALLRSPQFFHEVASYDCVREALKHSEDATGKNSETHKVIQCSRRNQSIGINKVTAPCWNDERLIDYTHSLVADAVNCMDDTSWPIDRKEIFGVINHESHFVADVTSHNGTGFMQLVQDTHIDAKGFKTTYPPNRVMVNLPPNCSRSCLKWQRLNRNNDPKCYSYKKSVKPDRATHLMAPRCEIAGNDEGRKRNLIYGLAAHLYYRDLSRCLLWFTNSQPPKPMREILNSCQSALSQARLPTEMLSAGLSYDTPSNQDDIEAIHLMTRIMYKKGPGPAAENLQSLRLRYDTISAANIRSGVRGDAKSYFDGIESDLKRVNDAVGRECSL